VALTFKCICGKNLTVPESYAGGTVNCPFCQAQVIAPKAPQTAGPTIRIDRSELDFTPPPEPKPDEESETIPLETEGDARTTAMKANRRFAGKVCAVCQGEIKLGEDICLCDSCKLPYHVACWKENGGCAAYGCEAAPTKSKPMSQVDFRMPPGHFPDENVEDLPRRRRETHERYRAPARTSGLAIASLVLALCPFICCIGPLAAIILGHLAQYEIKNSDGTLRGQGMAATGLILGYVFGALTLMWFLMSGHVAQFLH
jgi:hypothetical protein